MAKRFTPPLPFRGNKRYSARQFAAVLREHPEVTTVVDLFGGSGLLSRVAKDTLPDARVVYNDFDYYTDRLANIGRTNLLVSQLHELVKGYSYNSRLSSEVKEKCLRIIREHAAVGPVDFVTLASNLLFSGKRASDYTGLARPLFYQCVTSTPYDADGYLDGLEVTHSDYRRLLAEFEAQEGVLFVADPPYINTECSSYEGEWSASDNAELINAVRHLNYIYFTSHKSKLIELPHPLPDNFSSPLFPGAAIYARVNRVNYKETYKDIMLVKI